MKDIITNAIFFIIIVVILNVVKHYQGFETAVITGLSFIVTDVYEVRRKLKS